jgi:CheY-like chemotaxis protein
MKKPEAITEILLVDDNPADIDLTSDVLAKSLPRSHVTTVADGEEALAFLRHRGKHVAAAVPNLIVLDLNLPGKDGRAVLAEIKTDPALKRIPVVVFTTSQADHDIERSYELGANCYVSKPGNLPEFVRIVKSIDDFWLGTTHLPFRVEL